MPVPIRSIHRSCWGEFEGEPRLARAPVAMPLFKWPAKRFQQSCLLSIAPPAKTLDIHDQPRVLLYSSSIIWLLTVMTRELA